MCISQYDVFFFPTLLIALSFFFFPGELYTSPTKMHCFSEAAEALKEVNLWPVWEAGLGMNT